MSLQNIESNPTVSLQKQVSALPQLPGVYQYFNAKNEIIYIGKAKNLYKRVLNYFIKKHELNKTFVLVKNIAYLKYIVVESEADALLLENNLIKQYRPRYNVMLKDDKTYPSICISNEEFPRVFKTRKIEKNGSEYFGPYTSVKSINFLLDTVYKVFQIRTCKIPMTSEGIRKNKYKLCLKYHIHLCNGICEGRETRDQYLKNIENISQIIKGNAVEIQKYILQEIKQCSSKLEFERAFVLKQKYDLLGNFISKTIIANTIIESTDVFGYDQTENSAFVTILRVENGAIIQGFTVEYKKQIDEEKEDIMALAILNLREKFNSDSKEIIVPFEIEFPINNVKIIIPIRGDRKKLLTLAQQNTAQYKLDQLKQHEKMNPDQRGMKLMKNLQQKLKLEKIPVKIDIFDVSTIAGSNTVAVCVVYYKGKPLKKQYRKYIIKTVAGADDYASMREAVRRRYKRMINEHADLPDLIIADGGTGQMTAIRQIVEEELGLNITIAGLAKNDKHRTNEILTGFPPKTVGLKSSDTLFKFFAAMQDEVHRFAIKFHREKRSKTQIESELDNIKGIGKETKNELLKYFKSLKRIKNAELAELQNSTAKHKAKIIYDYFHKQ
ncbi:MAG: excinuclease ABC subunit UvrC [Prevotellaceae bacterium]|jgi:excinuclease ABC subunit C|nr:excinuclease ABC subunit UvrC [Prevotellaceae bacterium]